MAAEEMGYFLKSEEETNRLANQHDVIKDEMGGLVLAPLNLSKPLRILDSATADGTWIRDLAASTAPIEHQFVGTDIDASNFPANPHGQTNFPANPPHGQTYFAQDINKPWPEEWKETFDFVHQRLALVGSGPAAQQAIGNLAALVKPGGWIQLIEATNDLPEETGPAMRNFVTIMKGVFSMFGASLSLGNDLPALVKTAGFENVQDRIAMLKLGAKNPKPRIAAQGIYSTGVAAAQLAKVASNFPEGHISLSAAQVQSVPEELKVELIERGAVYPLRIVWARKPGA